MMNCRKYKVQADPDGEFFCGLAFTGEQILMGLGESDLVLVSFDSNGSFLGCYRKQVDTEVPEDVSDGEKRYEQVLQRMKALEEWQAELALTPADILIRKFSVPEANIGIAEMPGSYIRRIEQLANLNVEDKVEVERNVADWKSKSKYVLWWGKEYWMNEEGEVTDT